ncbi:MAG TPA: nickel pincer cofactor biosynthesis protein LarC [Blastocatellia bacterium]
MRLLYFDCFAGASGDMIVGAMLDLGLDFEELNAGISQLNLDGYRLSARKLTKSGISATKFEVELELKRQPHRGFHDIKHLVEQSGLNEAVKNVSIRVFQRLAEAEAEAHGKSIEEIHFHEVGAVDSIIDIVGASIGFGSLGIDQFVCSAIRTGFGTVNTEHGTLPIPAPGTLALLRGAPVYAGDVEGEFLTPTGAAILTTLCTFGPMPPSVVQKAGHGAGSRDYPGLPNVLRITVAEAHSAPDTETVSSDQRFAGFEQDRVIVIETNIDDMNPQAYGYIFERAFELGALDAFITPVQMKKNRPGCLLTVLAAPEKLGSLAAMLVAETTTLGVRYYEAARQILSRTTDTVETKYGTIRIKVARRGTRTLHFQPEYDDCVEAARRASVSLIEVQSAAAAAYNLKFSDIE